MSNIIDQFMYTGYPTNEERLIVGLGLGGSGQDIDTTIITPSVISTIHSVIVEPEPTLNVSTALIASRKRRAAHSRFARMAVNISATRCPHRNTAGEVCQHLSGMLR